MKYQFNLASGVKCAHMTQYLLSRCWIWKVVAWIAHLAQDFLFLLFSQWLFLVSFLLVFGLGAIFFPPLSVPQSIGKHLADTNWRLISYWLICLDFWLPPCFFSCKQEKNSKSCWKRFQRYILAGTEDLIIISCKCFRLFVIVFLPKRFGIMKCLFMWIEKKNNKNVLFSSATDN